MEQPSEEENQSETDKPSDNNDEQQTEPEEPAEQLPIVKEPGWVTGIYKGRTRTANDSKRK